MRLARMQQAGVRRHRPDYKIVLYMGLLMLLGLVIMYAIGPQRAQVLTLPMATDFYTATYFFGKQALSLGLAVAVFIAISKIPFHWFQAHARTLFLVGIIASVVLADGGMGQCRYRAV